MYSVFLSGMSNHRFEAMFGPRSHTVSEGVTVFWEAPDSYPKHFAHLSEAQKFLKVKEVDIKSAMITGKALMTTKKPLSLEESMGFRDRDGRCIVLYKYQSRGTHVL